MKNMSKVQWGALLAGMLLPVVLNAKDLPNIVVILSDDYGYGSATCNGTGKGMIDTPNIDRLATEGRRFTDANTTSSVCSPTRYSMLTGRYCWRTSLKHEVLGTTSPLHIEPGRLTLASLLKKHGYSTAAVGKWHLGYGDAARTDFTAELKPGPLEIGFDYHFGVPSNHGDISGVYVENHRVVGLQSSKLTPETTGKNFKGKPFLGLDAPHRVDIDVMPHITTKAVDWIEKQTRQQPFFLYFTPVAVHAPITPSEKTEGTSKAGPYGDWIHELDVSVGRVLDALDSKGFTENTLVLFTSDNGGVFKPTKPGEATDAFNAGLKVNGAFRGGKHDVWDGGFRVPYLVRWPGHVPAESVCHEPLSLVDTLATVTALVGDKLPPIEVAAEDSYNMLPAWLGKKHSRIRPDMILHSADGNFAIRRNGWKWIEGGYHPATRIGALRSRTDQYKKQLYNIREDIGETRDSLFEHPEKSRQLEALLNRYREGTYSRELPPPPPPKEKVAPPGPVGGQLFYRGSFDKDPPDRWTVVRGRWTTADGVLKGSQRGGEPTGAAVRMPLKLTNCDIQYKLSCPIDASHILRVQSHQKDIVFLVYVSPRHLSIVKQKIGVPGTTGKVTLAEETASLSPGEWSDVHIQFINNEIAVKVGETVVRATDEILAGAKLVMALMVNGTGVGFKDLTVHGGDAAPLKKTSTQQKATQNLRMLSYNIRHGKGVDQQVDLKRIAKVICAQNPDLVALQEVDKKCERSGNRDIAAELGRLTGMRHCFGKFMDFQEGEYGMAILSRFPIRETVRHQLPRGAEPRCALEAKVQAPGLSAPLSFVCIHNDWTNEDIRIKQVQALLKSLREQDNPIVLAGDFNGPRSDASMKLLERAGWKILEKDGGKVGNTYPSDSPNVEIDFLVLKGFHPESVEHNVIDERIASDHRPVYATLTFRKE